MNIHSPRIAAALLFGFTTAVATPAFAVPTGQITIDSIDGSIGSIHNGGSPNPAQAYLQSVSYAGSGCGLGTVGTSISTDRTTFTLIFDSYVAASGFGVPMAEAEKTCLISLNLNIPASGADTVVTLDYRGYVQLDAGLDAARTATESWNGNPLTIAGGSDIFHGSVSKDYLGTDIAQFHLSPGDSQPLAINSQIQITQAVPEPTTLSLTGAGMFLLWWRRRILA